MKPKISMLIGSGFSRPAGIKGVPELNERLRAIREDEIMVHTSEIALFLNGQQDNNRWMNADIRMFVQEFLLFYSEQVLKDVEVFDYEEFYDFYSSYLNGKGNKELIEGFHAQFAAKYSNMHVRDCLNSLGDFNRTYNQLIASLLGNIQYWDDGTTSNYPPYDAFIGFLLKAVETSDVKIHTLNHDMLLDWLGYHHSNLYSKFSDGFQLEGSPFYGELNRDYPVSGGDTLHKTYTVKLERFVDKYDSPISLFKLHGSIQHRIVNTQRSDEPVVRIKTNYGIEKYFYEVRAADGSKLEWVPEDVSPDVLSGTTNKILHYTRDPYYARLFQHFKENLLGSDKLVIIGYGFKDEEINRYLVDYFLDAGKQAFVINRSEPQSDLINRYAIKVIKSSITDLPHKEWLTVLA